MNNQIKPISNKKFVENKEYSFTHQEEKDQKLFEDSFNQFELSENPLQNEDSSMIETKKEKIPAKNKKFNRLLDMIF